MWVREKLIWCSAEHNIQVEEKGFDIDDDYTHCDILRDAISSEEQQRKIMEKEWTLELCFFQRLFEIFQISLPSSLIKSVEKIIRNNRSGLYHKLYSSTEFT